MRQVVLNRLEGQKKTGEIEAKGAICGGSD
jgi:hypothetical protein